MEKVEGIYNIHKGFYTVVKLNRPQYMKQVGGELCCCCHDDNSRLSRVWQMDKLMASRQGWRVETQRREPQYSNRLKSRHKESWPRGPGFGLPSERAFSHIRR